MPTTTMTRNRILGVPREAASSVGGAQLVEYGAHEIGRLFSRGYHPWLYFRSTGWGEATGIEKSVLHVRSACFVLCCGGGHGAHLRREDIARIATEMQRVIGLGGLDYGSHSPWESSMGCRIEGSAVEQLSEGFPGVGFVAFQRELAAAGATDWLGWRFPAIYDKDWAELTGWGVRWRRESWELCLV